jgi:O-antigen ligase
MQATWPRAGWLIPLSLGLWSAAIATTPNTAAKLALGVPVAVAALAWWSILRPHRWLLLFFVCLLLTPPLPIPLGDSGVHLAPALALLGVFAGIMRMDRWRTSVSPLAVAFIVFLSVLLASVGAAALYSGADIAGRSLFRVGLFGIGVYVLFYALAGPRSTEENPLRLARFLFLTGIAAALFGCVDYYYQIPAPAGFEAQFVWLDEGVFRRAQGLFYEASTLGNFCAFFLVMTIVAVLRQRRDAPCSGFTLAAGAVVFSTALILSYSRASLLNVVVACGALAFLRRVRIAKPLLAACLIALIAGVAVRTLLPSFSASYWSRIAGSLQYFWYSPDGVLSGRLTHWTTITDFLVREPWHAVFGIGYKTLPYSNFAGSAVIADNTYLSLLAETGVVGLISFLALNAAILRNAFRAARSANPRAAFFGEWIFCFWAGEMVQMLSGDLITYWRVLPVYCWVLGTAVREAQEAG